MKLIKTAALLLAMVMMFGMVASAEAVYVPVEVQARLSNTTVIAQGQGFATRITDKDAVSQHIVAPDKVAGVTVLAPSHGNSVGALTIKVYKWAGDVSSTLKTKPLAEKRYTNFADNTFLTLPVEPTTNDIMIHVCDGEEAVSVWVPRNENPPEGFSQETYYNGTRMEGSMNSSVSVYSEEGRGHYPTRNAYEYFISGEPDEIEGHGVQFSSDHYDGENQNPYNMVNLNVPNVGILGYYNVDFGDVSPKSIEARIYLMQAQHFNDVNIHIDSPQGPMIGNMRFFHDQQKHRMDWGSNHYWTTETFKLFGEVTGVHDLYFVTREGNGPSYILGKFKFSHEDLPHSTWEQEWRDYKPVDDSTLKPTYSDTWVATDILGRKVADYSVAGDKKDKDVFLFYWISSAMSGYKGQSAMNMQKVVDNYAGDLADIKNNYDYAPWNAGTPMWNESIYGHYTSYDTWVMRKQLELFSAAGIDCIAYDASNGITFPVGYMNMGREIAKMRQLGYNVPKFTFVFPWSANPANTYNLENVYLGMYSTGLFSDSYYYKDGKPLIMAFPGGDLTNGTGIDEVDAFHQDIQNFFTFRAPNMGYKNAPTRDDSWPWLQVYPQHGFGPKEDGGYEMVSVGIAQNSNDNVSSYSAMNAEGVYGRSYTYKDKHSKLSESSMFYGYNFQEQWERAFELDPDAVFITGWNEWFCGRSKEDGQGTKNAFVDLWIDEYSRDAEPTKGVLQDTYFLQMVSNIRKFKGTNPTPVASAEKTISLGDFGAFADVKPEFIGFKGGTEPRNETGFGVKRVNETGRNDIVLSKVARDSENLYFYVETAENLTPHTDKNWMRLYINADRTYKTGWEGYDYIINRVSPTSDKVVVEKYTGTDRAWYWETAGQCDYKYSGNKMMITVPKALMGVGENVDIEFKWHDNGVADGDAMDFYVNGDTAPVGRFAYRYVDEASVNTPLVDEPVDIANDVNFLTAKFVMMGIDKPVAYSAGHRTLIDPANEAITPLIIKDKTLVPIRFIAESLGGKVGWDATKNAATIDFNAKHAVITEGSDKMAVDGKAITLQTPAQTINDRMYVPLRDVAEGFGLDCFWEDPGLIIIGTKVFQRVYTDDTVVPRAKYLLDIK